MNWLDVSLLIGSVVLSLVLYLLWLKLWLLLVDRLAVRPARGQDVRAARMAWIPGPMLHRLRRTRHSREGRKPESRPQATGARDET